MLEVLPDRYFGKRSAHLASRWNAWAGCCEAGGLRRCFPLLPLLRCLGESPGRSSWRQTEDVTAVLVTLVAENRGEALAADGVKLPPEFCAAGMRPSCQETPDTR